ncbi:NDR1/HIN1-like protein 10 [Salvia miltiorrhiza]|uniref:NDR1/HIN1-like protein 10 n=1 Tax=Salvia miltiorrhiza TaxID=226208 RepID=UPI0025ABB5EC|nr:NDR1/HIN1-like protein 10 [Salvia miltiorrhiza]
MADGRRFKFDELFWWDTTSTKVVRENHVPKSPVGVVILVVQSDKSLDLSVEQKIFVSCTHVDSIPNQQQNYQYDAKSVRRATCLRRIFAFVIGLIVIFGTATFIVWLILRPQLPEFRVDSLSISNFTLGNDLLISFTSEIKLTAKNPNKKMKLGYDHIETAIYYQSYSLSETTVAPFYQGTKNETSLTVRFAAAGSFLEKVAVDEITGERGKNDNVNFNLRMLSRVRFEAKVWRTRRRFLKVFCGDLVLGLPTSGRSEVLTGGPRQCCFKVCCATVSISPECLSD